MSIDLSSHSMEVVKMLSSQLVSKNDKCRIDTVSIVATLGLQCSDSSSIEEVVKFFFGVLKG